MKQMSERKRAGIKVSRTVRSGKKRTVACRRPARRRQLRDLVKEFL